MSSSGLDQYIYVKQGKLIIWMCFLKIVEVNATIGLIKSTSTNF